MGGGVSTGHRQHSRDIMARARQRFAEEVSQHQFDSIWLTNNGSNLDFGVAWMDLLCHWSAAGVTRRGWRRTATSSKAHTTCRSSTLNPSVRSLHHKGLISLFLESCFSCRHECCLLSDLSMQLLKKMRIFFSLHRQRLGHITENGASFISFHLTSNKFRGSWGRGRAGHP